LSKDTRPGEEEGGGGGGAAASSGGGGGASASSKEKRTEARRLEEKLRDRGMDGEGDVAAAALARANSSRKEGMDMDRSRNPSTSAPTSSPRALARSMLCNMLRRAANSPSSASVRAGVVSEPVGRRDGFLGVAGRKLGSVPAAAGASGFSSTTDECAAPSLSLRAAGAPNPQHAQIRAPSDGGLPCAMSGDDSREVLGRAECCGGGECARPRFPLSVPISVREEAWRGGGGVEGCGTGP
jgi:hypothetical protein